jgi:hypothetical protein
MSGRRDDRRRELPFSRRTHCSVGDAAHALGTTEQAVRALVQSGGIDALADGRIVVASVLSLRARP